MQEQLELAPKRTAHEMFSLIIEQQAGELTVKDFCNQHNVSEGTFYYWRKKYQQKAKPANELRSGGFSLLHFGEEMQSGAGLFAEYKGLKLYQEVPVSYLKELIR